MQKYLTSSYVIMYYLWSGSGENAQCATSCATVMRQAAAFRASKWRRNITNGTQGLHHVHSKSPGNKKGKETEICLNHLYSAFSNRHAGPARPSGITEQPEGATLG